MRANPQFARIPIIILSATADMAEFRSTQDLGAVMFAPKPFKPQTLLTHVRMLLDQ